ncbi:hypothetical protein GCM10025866_33680 [Naasia aerilata]|uniref:Uncharacterized protein n=1 Tax=Naasia aerilata TaxID=1162966 RepID=A0ABN6XR35_9MICO|nr:hypothetical protein GCM10025866_33680 [Naasia aerilata]
MGATTAAVPHAKAATTSPDAAPSIHSASSIGRCSTGWPRLLAKASTESTVTPARIDSDAGVTSDPSAYTSTRFIPPSSSM